MKITAGFTYISRQHIRPATSDCLIPCSRIQHQANTHSVIRVLHKVQYLLFVSYTCSSATFGFRFCSVCKRNRKDLILASCLCLAFSMSALERLNGFVQRLTANSFINVGRIIPCRSKSDKVSDTLSKKKVTS